ncbi:glutamate formiminotransferase [Propionigenium maris DSM 9537]|uniref:glutamate formimidoyltransferase n=1 Tax=Propionigenium maris DSM 9537 TaxID=1123000 RepID=A0A9W6LM57_9FUSO|nr:glutamate formimidoyltransferase [Propionigenium maris]GLI55098.1 glutamate formiminotransferase [Propionigenium maris DSM 9537]
MAKIVQCVPNYSEGRDLEKVEKIVASYKNREGVKLLSCEPDADYNRTVVTVIGDPVAVAEAVVESAGVAAEVIDMTTHSGEHSRMGAIDVVPFIPIKDMTMDECVDIAKKVGEELFQKHGIPVFLYEEAATRPERTNLAKVRKGQFEGMPEKLKDPQWHPDFGRDEIHPRAGVTAVGARMPLVAYNIDLDTSNLEIGKKIAAAIRHSGGGFRYIKAGAVETKGIIQVTMNITNYKKTSIYRVFETVKMEAKRYGVHVTGSEIVGLAPMEAFVESAEYYLGLYGFSKDKVLETHLMD